MARYMGNIATWNVVIPGRQRAGRRCTPSCRDRTSSTGWSGTSCGKLGITPSEPAGDSTFLRRAYLDVIGRLPTPDETRAFLADTAADKRARLVDALLERPEYADYWANKWADLLRPNPYRVGIKATLNFDAWIRDAFRQNMPYDQFVSRAGHGHAAAPGPTGLRSLFRDRRSPDEMTTIVSQLFLGVRLDCAKCHHHPFEVWGQDDFYSLAAFFARVGYKGTGLSPPISGGEEIVFTAASGTVKHPLTGQTHDGQAAVLARLRRSPRTNDPRVALAALDHVAGQPVFRRRWPSIGSGPS